MIERSTFVPSSEGALPSALMQPVGTQTPHASAAHGVYVRFFRQSVPIKDANGEVKDFSPEQIYVEYEIPGDPDHKPIKKLNKELKKRHAAEFAAWEREEAAKPDGMPVELLPGVTKQQVLKLKFHGIHTIEQAANLSDIAMQNFGLGADDVKRKAIAVVHSRTAAHAEKARADSLEKQLAELRDAVASMQAPQPLVGQAKRRGRPPKVKTAEAA